MKVLDKPCQERVQSNYRRLHPLDTLVNVLDLPSKAHVDSLVEFLDLLVEVCLGVFPFLSVFALLEEGFEGLDCGPPANVVSLYWVCHRGCHSRALDLSSHAVLCRMQSRTAMYGSSDLACNSES